MMCRSHNVVFLALTATFAVCGSAVGLGHSVLKVNQRASSLARLQRNITGPLEPASFVGADSIADIPIRIYRGGSEPEKPNKDKSGGNWMGCGNTHKVNSSSNKNDICPDACPFFVQDWKDDDFCTFACVTEKQCAEYRPETPIGDKDLGVCRSCVVEGCNECDMSVTEDRCSKCQAGYELRADGQCYFKYRTQLWIVIYVVLGICAFVAVWVFDMVIRPTVNQSGLDHGLEFRSDQLLRQPKDENGDRDVWPLSTNFLTKGDVAGPGMLLHFRFQVALMVWAVFVAMVWVCFAYFVDPALWILGTRKFGTPRMNCILVAWGYETQQRLMWTKVLFLWIVYLVSFAMCMAWGIYQKQSFQKFDFEHKTMKDFVGILVGLPKISAREDVEGDLKAEVQKATNVDVVGVSVGWDYGEQEDAVNEALQHDLRMEEGPRRSVPLPEYGWIRSKLFNMENAVLGLPSLDAEQEAAGENDSVEDMLMELETGPRAFVVFKTQEDRDTAMSKIKEDGFQIKGARDIIMEETSAEPVTVQWQNFSHSPASEKVRKIIIGFGFIALACLFWAVVFYSPYAYYVLTFNYENGRSPGFEVGMAFSMIVVVGNVIMAEVCVRIADYIGFRFTDEKEAAYMILYCIACMFNVALDFVTTYITAEMVMEALGFRNYFGKPFHEIDNFFTKFETYGMQRSLAENTYTYAFPASFLIPFVIEPIPTIFMPLWIGKWIVKNHPELQGADAEDFLVCAPMEMGRYADCLLNAILAVLIFYFPGGYTWILFFAMAGSHVWIYVLDHFKVLRAIPACTFASYDIEWYCQAMFAPIVGIIAAVLVFKGNCEPGYHCTSGWTLCSLCTLGWLVHTVFHIACLYHVVPMFELPEPEEDLCADETFETLAAKLPCSWFTANPVHCLRSKHHFKQEPPCNFFHLGKEQYQRRNAAIGCFYEEKSIDDKQA